MSSSRQKQILRKMHKSLFPNQANKVVSLQDILRLQKLEENKETNRWLHQLQHLPVHKKRSMIENLMLSSSSHSSSSSGNQTPSEKISSSSSVKRPITTSSSKTKQEQQRPAAKKSRILTNGEIEKEIAHVLTTRNNRKTLETFPLNTIPPIDPIGRSLTLRKISKQALEQACKNVYDIECDDLGKVTIIIRIIAKEYPHLNTKRIENLIRKMNYRK